MTLLISWSQPHTGIAFILIVLCYSFLERFYFKNDIYTIKFIGITFGFLVLHFAYYMGFLNLNADHVNIVQTHWVNTDGKPGFLLKAINFIPGYILVFLLFIGMIRTPQRVINLFKQPFKRFLLVLFFITFLLSNHEFAFTPQQPLHFEKGYIYLSLFLLSVPFLLEVFIWIKTHARSTLIKTLLVTSLVGVSLSDNIAVWLVFL